MYIAHSLIIHELVHNVVEIIEKEQGQEVEREI